MLKPREIKQFHKALGNGKYDRLPIIFDALGEPNRCKIVRLLIKKDDDAISVVDIARILGISQSLTSQHLKILLSTGLVTKDRSGRNIFYHLNYDDEIVSALVKAVLSNNEK